MKKITHTEMFQNILIIVIVLLSYLLCRITRLEDQKKWIQMAMAGMALLAFTCLILNRKTAKDKIWIIIVLGMILRIGYMLYTPCNVRSHDLWEITSEANGHAGYLLRLLETGKLPDSNTLQLYQQPLFYLTGAVVSKLINGILHCTDPFYLTDAAKTVSCAASCLSLVGCKRICEECELDALGQKTAMILTAFLPAFCLTGGRVNPDALAGMFMIYALLYTLRWAKNPNWKNTVILALLYGCGVMTKISCGVVSLVTAIVFLGMLIKKVRSKEAWMILRKYIVFGMISLPLGLWFGIRNYLKFGQSLFYVLPLEKTITIYTGDHSLFQRFIGIDFSSLLRSPYVSITEEYSAPVYFLKSAMFGEFRYEVPGWIPVLLIFCAATLSVLAATACWWQLTRNRNDCTGKVLLLSTVLYYGSMLWFYYKYPFACSMDFRYMVFMAVPIGILLGKFRMDCRKHEMWIDIIVYGYMIASCLFFCFL